METLAKNPALDQTAFTLCLIWLIVQDGFGLEDISLNGSDVHDAWASGYSPYQLYNDIWQKDAGNFYAL